MPGFVASLLKIRMVILLPSSSVSEAPTKKWSLPRTMLHKCDIISPPSFKSCEAVPFTGMLFPARPTPIHSSKPQQPLLQEPSVPPSEAVP